MTLDFDLQNVSVTEFGIGRDDGDSQVFVAVPVDADVQSALHEMVQATWQAMQDDEDGPTPYEPSEKHATTEYLTVSLDDDLAEAIRQLHEAAMLDFASDALAEPGHLFCYFARLTDKKGRRLTALRRATHFKGVLKKRLIRLVSDSMRLIEDSVFKLDNDFDLLVDASQIHILRPSGFEFAGRLQEAILGSVRKNMKAMRKDLPFVDFDAIEAYAAARPRAARYVASIRGQKETRSIDKAALKRQCKSTGVEIKESKGKLIVAEGHELGFLQVLDRRLYEVTLVKEKPERYRAASRKKIDG